MTTAIFNNPFLRAAILLFVAGGFGAVPSIAAAQTLQYSEQFTQGQTYNAGSSPYDSWQSFRASLPASGVKDITLKGSLDAVGRTCNDPVKAQQIADAMRNGATGVGVGTSTLSVSCNGFVWQTGSCSNNINDANNLELSVGTGGTCACSANYTIRPGILNSNWGGIGGQSCGAPSQTLAVVVNGSSTVSSVGKTVQTIQRFVSRRNDLLLSSEPDMSRQIGRLQEFSSSGGSATGTNFAAGDAADAARAAKSLFSDQRTFAGAAVGPLGASIGNPAFGQSFGSNAASGYTLGDAPPLSVGSGTASGGDGSMPRSFSISMSQITGYAASVEEKRLQNKVAGLGVSEGELPGVRLRPNALDIWLEGRIVDFSDDRAGGWDSHNALRVFYLGADYILSPSLLVGVVAQYDSMRMRSDANSTDIEGDGWMVGPYATLKLSDHMFFQGRAAWGQSSNSISPLQTYTDDFDSERWLVRGALQGQWQYGQLFLRPGASVSYIEDETESYTDSVGSAIPRIKNSLGQAKFGPEIAYRMASSGGGLIEPRVKLEGIWNFADDTDAGTVGDTVVGVDEFRGKAEVGLRMSGPAGSDGIILDLSTSYDGLGSGSYHAVEGRAALRVPLN